MTTLLHFLEKLKVLLADLESHEGTLANLSARTTKAAMPATSHQIVEAVFFYVFGLQNLRMVMTAARTNHSHF